MRLFIMTDFPAPVVPAISPWGMRAMFWKFGLPVMSFPSATRSGCGESVKSGEERREARPIDGFERFGTSIPTSDLPGIGASIRIVPAARLSSSSFCSPTMRAIRTPSAGFSAYRVTTGPISTSSISTSIPNFLSVRLMMTELFLMSPPLARPLSLLSSERGGGSYWPWKLDTTKSVARLPSPSFEPNDFCGFSSAAGSSSVSSSSYCSSDGVSSGSIRSASSSSSSTSFLRKSWGMPVLKIRNTLTATSATSTIAAASSPMRYASGYSIASPARPPRSSL